MLTSRTLSSSFVYIYLQTVSFINESITESKGKVKQMFYNKSKSPSGCGEKSSSQGYKFYENNDYDNVGIFPNPFGVL